MKLKDKVFTMRHDQPYLTPIGINIPEFAKLWEADKSEEKTEYAGELAYIYHMWEYDSPYYDRKHKEEEIIRDYIGKKRWKPTKRLKDALAAYIKLDNCAEKRALDAAIVTCDRIADDLVRLKEENNLLQEVSRELDLEIRKADNINTKVDLLKSKLDIQEQQMKISGMVSKVMTTLEKNIETTLSLRKKVTTSVFKGENADSMVGEFLYDKLMDEIEYEQKESNNEQVEE